MKQYSFIILLFFLSISITGKAQYYNTVPDRTLYYEVYNGTTNKTHKESSRIKQTVTRNDSIFIIQSDFFPPVNEQIKDSISLLKIVQTDENTIIFLKDEETEIKNLKQMISSITQNEDTNNHKEFSISGSLQITINEKSKKGDKIQTSKFTLNIGSLSATTTLNGEFQGINVIQTPAGEFNCIKVTYKIKAKFLFFSETVRVIEWYAANIGLVKREEYNEKQKSKNIKTLIAMKETPK